MYSCKANETQHWWAGARHCEGDEYTYVQPQSERCWCIVGAINAVLCILRSHREFTDFTWMKREAGVLHMDCCWSTTVFQHRGLLNICFMSMTNTTLESNVVIKTCDCLKNKYRFYIWCINGWSPSCPRYRGVPGHMHSSIGMNDKMECSCARAASSLRNSVKRTVANTSVRSREMALGFGGGEFFSILPALLCVEPLPLPENTKMSLLKCFIFYKDWI